MKLPRWAGLVAILLIAMVATFVIFSCAHVVKNSGCDTTVGSERACLELAKREFAENGFNVDDYKITVDTETGTFLSRANISKF